MAEQSQTSAEVRLRIRGEHGTIDVGALHKALGALLELLKAGGVGANLVISDLREGSAEVGVRLRYADVEVEERFARIVSGLGDLGTQRVRNDWDAAMLESAVDMASALEYTGVSGLEVRGPGLPYVEVTPTTLETARSALTVSSVSIGSITGRIHRFFDHKSRREFGMIDDLTQMSVKVTFSVDKEPKVLRAVGKTVQAWGELRRNRDGRKVSLKLDDFEVIDAPPRRPLSIDDITGVLGDDWTDGEGSVEAVRRQRDGE